MRRWHALVSHLALLLALAITSSQASRWGAAAGAAVGGARRVALVALPPSAGVFEQVWHAVGESSNGEPTDEHAHHTDQGHGSDEHDHHEEHVDGHTPGHGSHDDHGAHSEHGSHVSEEHAHEHDSVHGAHDDHGGHGGHDSHESEDHAHGHDSEHGSHDSHDSGEHGHGHDSEHGGHGEHGGHKPSRGASSVAVGLVATTVMIPLVTWMALSDGLIGELTMKMLDTFVSIFLAVLWFSAFDQFLKTFKVASWFPMAAEVVCLLQVVILYCVAIGVAWLWRDKTMHLTTFTVCGAHYIAFAGIGASAGAQATMSDLVHVDWSPVMSFLFVVMAMGFIGCLYLANWMLFRSEKAEAKEFQKSIDEMEVDIAGLVISFLVTQAVRQVITGHYPVLHHFFLQLRGEVPDASSTEYQRYLMLCWSVMLTIGAAIALPWIDEKSIRSGGHWAKLGTRFLKVNIIMLVAWGYLLWGTWEFYDRFKGDPMFGHMLFACLCTFAALLVLYLLAMVQGRMTNALGRETNAITVGGISLVAAWSWEHCFTLAFDVIGLRYQVGYGGLVPKVIMALVIPCILLPTYVKHVRTAVLFAEQKEEIEREEYEQQIKSKSSYNLTGGSPRDSNSGASASGASDHDADKHPA